MNILKKIVLKYFNESIYEICKDDTFCINFNNKTNTITL